MKYIYFTLLLTFFSTLTFAQSDNKNLNVDLKEMKEYFLAGDYENFANYTYPKIIEMMGGKSKMVKGTKQVMDKIKSEGFSFINLNFKNASGFLKKENELQCTLTQQLTMQTPQGKIESEYTLIAISGDNGTTWTFMDTSGKTKETMLKYFPNLHEDLIIKPKTQKMVE